MCADVKFRVASMATRYQLHILYEIADSAMGCG
jgi:hypothetical protein